jgi:hypothetical protein
MNQIDNIRKESITAGDIPNSVVAQNVVETRMNLTYIHLSSALAQNTFIARSHVAEWLSDALSSRHPGFGLTLVFCVLHAQGAAIFTGSSQETSILFHSHNMRQGKFVS